MLIPYKIMAEISFPINWNSEGYLIKFYPITRQFFLEGGLESTIDLVKKDMQAGDLFFYAGAGIYTGMGYQEGLVVFDPRDIHYSLIPGFRFERGNFIYDVNLLHDCFHEIDRKEGRTQIWNVGRFEFMNRSFFPAYRREEVLNNYKRGFVFDPSYYAALWYFPWWGYEWVQYDHDYIWATETKFNLSFYRHDRFSVEFRSNLRLYLDKLKDIEHKAGLHIYAVSYGTEGTAAMYAGWISDRQSIKPKGNRFIFGVKVYQ